MLKSPLFLTSGIIIYLNGAQLTQDMFAGNSLIGDGNLHAVNLSGQDVTLPLDKGREGRRQRAEGAAVALHLALVQLQSADLRSAPLVIEIRVHQPILRVN